MHVVYCFNICLLQTHFQYTTISRKGTPNIFSYMFSKSVLIDLNDFLILGQKVKVTGSQSAKTLKAIEWLMSVMHCIECPASNFVLFC